MNWLKRKWREWNDSCDAEARKRGYDYAAGQLLIHKGSQETIEKLEAESLDTFGYSEVDRGVREALFDWTRLHPTLTMQTLSELRDWVYDSWGHKTPWINTSDKSALEAFAAHIGCDLAAVEAEIKADNRERNPAEQQLDAEWREAQDAAVTQSLVDLAIDTLADRAPRDPDYYGHPECNRVTNSPCPWSNSSPLADTCKFCGKNFPTWS